MPETISLVTIHHFPPFLIKKFIILLLLPSNGFKVTSQGIELSKTIVNQNVVCLNWIELKIFSNKLNRTIFCYRKLNYTEVLVMADSTKFWLWLIQSNSAKFRPWSTWPNIGQGRLIWIRPNFDRGRLGQFRSMSTWSNSVGIEWVEFGQILAKVDLAKFGRGLLGQIQTYYFHDWFDQI